MCVCVRVSHATHTPPVHMETTPPCTHVHTQSDSAHTCTHVWTQHSHMQTHMDTTSVQQAAHAALRVHTCMSITRVCERTRGHTCLHIGVCRRTQHTLTHAGCIHTCVLAHACTHVNTHTQASAPQQPLPCFPSSVQSPRVTSLQEISKEAVYTISSKEIIIIITLRDLAVKFL